MPAPAKRTELLNAIVERIGARSYLEIGINKGRNFRAIRCETKVGVDPKPVDESIVPLASDEFFATNREKFDVIFIDGLHEADQVQRDIVNAVAVLNDGGMIVCHDMNPCSEKVQQPTPTGGVWTGDCWKAFVRLRSTHRDLQMCIVDIETGCAVIRRGAATPLEVHEALTYRNLSRRRSKWLNLVSSEAFDEWLRGDMCAPLIASPSSSPLWRTVLHAVAIAVALVALFLIAFLIFGFMDASYSSYSLSTRAQTAVDGIHVALNFIGLSAASTLLSLPLAAVAAVQLGIRAALPRPRLLIGRVITAAARIFTMLPSSLIGAIVGFSGMTALNAVIWVKPESDALPVFVMWLIPLACCTAMLVPTITYSTILAVRSLPGSRRESRFYPSLGRGELVRTVVLPNAWPRIITGIGIAVARVVCDISIGAMWFVTGRPISVGEPLLYASILSLGITAASWWLLRRGRPSA